MSNRQLYFKVKIILLFALSLLAISCTQDAHEKYPDHVKVRLPWYTKSGYQLSLIDLSTIDNMVFLAGKAARFLLSPNVQDGKLVGMTPILHTMRTSDGIYIPEDYLSAEMLTLYAHFEKLQDFDRTCGIDKLISNWPRQQTIAVAAQITATDGSVVRDNAMYIGAFDAFMFPVYDLPNLPLSLNQAVVGHEYFHAIFNELYLKTVDKSEVKTDEGAPASDLQSLEMKLQKERYQRYLVKGLNEGLADVWGWLYSGDFQFVSRSVHGYDRRNLNDKSHFVDLKIPQVRAMSRSGDPMDDSFYFLGSTYAQRLYSAANLAVESGKMSALELRVKLGKAIAISLTKLNPAFQLLKKDEFLDPLTPLKLIQAEIPEITIEIETKKSE